MVMRGIKRVELASIKYLLNNEGVSWRLDAV